MSRVRVSLVSCIHTSRFAPRQSDRRRVPTLWANKTQLTYLRSTKLKWTSICTFSHTRQLCKHTCCPIKQKDLFWSCITVGENHSKRLILHHCEQSEQCLSFFDRLFLISNVLKFTQHCLLCIKKVKNNESGKIIFAMKIHMEFFGWFSNIVTLAEVGKRSQLVNVSESLDNDKELVLLGQSTI